MYLWSWAWFFFHVISIHIKMWLNEQKASGYIEFGKRICDLREINYNIGRKILIFSCFQFEIFSFFFIFILDWLYRFNFGFSNVNFHVGELEARRGEKMFFNWIIIASLRSLVREDECCFFRLLRISINGFLCKYWMQTNANKLCLLEKPRVSQFGVRWFGVCLQTREN